MEQRRGIFRKRVPIEKLICWSKQSLHKPLLKSSRQFTKDAVCCFSLIQRIFGDKQPKGGLEEIQRLLDIGIENVAIRDEIYCQVCKQLTKNPDINKTILGWKLMSVLVITFPPSRKFENYLKCFIEEFIHDYEKFANTTTSTATTSTTTCTSTTDSSLGSIPMIHSNTIHSNSNVNLSKIVVPTTTPMNQIYENSDNPSSGDVTMMKTTPTSITMNTTPIDNEEDHSSPKSMTITTPTSITMKTTSTPNSPISPSTHTPINHTNTNTNINTSTSSITTPKATLNNTTTKDTHSSTSEQPDKMNDNNEKIKVLSQYCYSKLCKTCIIGPRGKTLSTKEIEQKMNAAFNFSMFGETLDDIMEDQEKEANSEKLRIPRIMKFLTDAILKLNGCHTEGIFRVPGDVDQITELRCRVEKKNYDLNGCTDPNVPASLLKLWLRELAEPLIPTSVYDECTQIGKTENEEGANAGQKAWELVQTLPEMNRLVIVYMIDFLRIIAEPENQPYTKMTKDNLAMVFAPNFLRCPSDDPEIIFNNTKFEQAFIRILMSNNNY